MNDKHFWQGYIAGTIAGTVVFVVLAKCIA